MKLHNVVILTIAASLAAAFAAGPQEHADRAREHRALALLGLVDPSLAVAWNQTVNEIAFAEDQFLTFKGVRAHAMMHIAMHDALNAVIPLYRQFAYRDLELFASPVAAAAQAARDVIVSEYPGHKARADAELARWISQTPDGLFRTRGIALGRRSAGAILAARIGDRWDFPGTYTFSTQPGAYQTTPPFNGFVLQPGFRFAVPFGLRSPGSSVQGLRRSSGVRSTQQRTTR